MGGSFPGGSANLPSDLGLGGSIEVDWAKFTERSIFSLTYVPSYTAELRNSSLDALNHAFSLNVKRRLTPRWTFGFSAAANYSTLEESLFAPTTLSNVASATSNSSQLSAALLAGNFSNNPQLGVILTNSPLVESPVASLLYGQRIFAASAQSTLSYSLSPRLSVTFIGGGNRTQPVLSNQSATTSVSSGTTKTTSETAGAAMSYSLSPDTQVGGSVTTSRVSSIQEDAYTTTSLVTFGRTLGKQWIIQLHGGVGVTEPVRQASFVSATRPLPAAGGSLVYKTTSHTFLGSFDHTVSDSYGLGASTSSTAGATWRWRRPGSFWSLESSFGWQQLQGNASANISGWRATEGITRALGPHLALFWQYTYLNYSGSVTYAPKLSESAIRVSMIWTPQPNIPR
jgi:hypothetical protein